MDEFFMDNLQNVTFIDFLSLVCEIVICGLLLVLFVSFVSWAFWYMVRTFRNIVK